MSFATALGDYIGGRNRARAAKASQQFEQHRETEQDKQTAALNAASLRSQGYDPTGQPLAPLAIPSALQQITPGNKGKGQPGAEDYVRHYLGLAAEATRQGRPDLAKQYTDQASAWGLAAERTATAGYRGAQQQEIAQGKIPEEQARATYYRDRLGVDLQKAKMALQAAQGHDAARVQGAQIAAAAAVQRAGITGQAAIDARILAGYYALQGRSMQDATAIAIQNARGAEAYAAAQGKATGEFPTFQPAQVPESPSFDAPQLAAPTYNVFYGAPSVGGGPQQPSGLTVPDIAPMTPQNAVGGPPGGGGKARSPIQQEIQRAHAASVTDPNQIAQALLAEGYPLAEVQSALGTSHAQPQDTNQANKPTRSQGASRQPKPLAIKPASRAGAAPTPPRIAPLPTSGNAAPYNPGGVPVPHNALVESAKQFAQDQLNQYASQHGGGIFPGFVRAITGQHMQVPPQLRASILQQLTRPPYSLSHAEAQQIAGSL